LAVNNPIGDEVFFTENPLTKPGIPKTPLSFTPLTRDVLPGAGDLIAIDAEFVRIAEPKVVDRGGRRQVEKPEQFSLARVSVLSSNGEPFIDDYITMEESEIQDYLTQFSGLHPGDLDPLLSQHHVTTLKHAYLKLRRLVDRGCRFVGHGLAKDFRIINIIVPPSQVIDTVELYHLSGYRKISLRFLASLLLDLNIQQETHDSIEDARTALLLYKKYVDLTGQRLFKLVLQLIYEVGGETNWNVHELDRGKKDKIVKLITMQKTSNKKLKKSKNE